MAKINAETQMGEKKARKLSIPQNYERITKGALRLELKDRVALRNLLSDSITKELAEMETILYNAKKLFNGTE